MNSQYFLVFLGVCGVVSCVVLAVVGAQICTVTLEVVSENKRRGVMRDERGRMEEFKISRPCDFYTTIRALKFLALWCLFGNMNIIWECEVHNERKHWSCVASHTSSFGLPYHLLVFRVTLPMVVGLLRPPLQHTSRYACKHILFTS